MLALAALVLSSLTVMAGPASAAPHQAASAGHCADMMPQDGEDRMSQAAIDCAIACSAVAGVAPAWQAASAPRPGHAALPPPAAPLGTNPEADPPPPRLRHA